MSVVVDTNVAAVASSLHGDAGPECVHACEKRLRAVVGTGGLVVDDSGLILDEYVRSLSMAGRPGVGRAFVKWAWDRQYDPAACTRVAITPLPPGGWRRFAEFPDDPALRGFDADDQKFAAAALAAGSDAPVLNAVDSDWADHDAALAAHGVRVEFLCPQHCAP